MINSKIKRLISVFITICIISSLFTTSAFAEPSAPRGRVVMSNGTVVTDTGSKLRGCFYSVDLYDAGLSYQQLAEIKENGFNALHVYAENLPNSRSAGYNSAVVDQLVEWTGQLGLYMILTIGGGTPNATADFNFIYDFWNYYAPRYKDKTHVIYEVKNEPSWWCPAYPNDIIAMEKNAFNIIRSNAPNTHVMMFSYIFLGTWDKVLADINNVGIDWSNASIAWHGYEKDVASITSTFNAIKNAGYYSICT